MIFLPRYPQVYCTTTSYTCRYFGKILQVSLELHVTQDTMIVFHLRPPFKPGMLRFVISLVLEGGRKYEKIDQ